MLGRASGRALWDAPSHCTPSLNASTAHMTIPSPHQVSNPAMSERRKTHKIQMWIKDNTFPTFHKARETMMFMIFETFKEEYDTVGNLML